MIRLWVFPPGASPAWRFRSSSSRIGAWHAPWSRSGLCCWAFSCPANLGAGASDRRTRYSAGNATAFRREDSACNPRGSACSRAGRPSALLRRNYPDAAGALGYRRRVCPCDERWQRAAAEGLRVRRRKEEDSRRPGDNDFPARVHLQALHLGFRHATRGAGQARPRHRRQPLS